MRIRTPTDLGALVRERRRDARLDQRTLAAKAGVSREWLIGLERGKPGVSLGLVLRTLSALGIALAVDEPSKPSARSTRSRMPDIDTIVRAAKKPTRGRG